MPLFEARDDELVPFRRVKGGPDLYEQEIEELLWENLDADVMAADAPLTWMRPRLGVTYRATVLANGSIRLENGREFAHPSKAAKEAAGIEAYDGWRAWQVTDGRSLADLRKQLLEQQSQSS